MFICGCFLFLSPSPASAQTTGPSTKPFEIVGHIDAPAIPESSGIVESRKHPGVFWTQNDSGNPAAVFATTREGKLLAEYRVKAPNVDWEDIAIDDAGNLYLADIGNNNHNRREVQIYRVAEPDPSAPPNAALAVDRTWRLTYPDDTPFDAESLGILGTHGLIIAKYRDGTRPGLYQFDLSAGEAPQPLKLLAVLPLRSPVTAAEVSRDGKQLAVMTVTGPNVYQIGLEAGKAETTLVWGSFFIDAVIEGVCFTDKGLLATTEARRIIFFPTPATQPTPHPSP